MDWRTVLVLISLGVAAIVSCTVCVWKYWKLHGPKKVARRAIRTAEDAIEQIEADFSHVELLDYQDGGNTDQRWRIDGVKLRYDNNYDQAMKAYRQARDWYQRARRAREVENAVLYYTRAARQAERTKTYTEKAVTDIQTMRSMMDGFFPTMD